MRYKGEIFPVIEIRSDKISLRGNGVTVEIPYKEIACLGDKDCKDTECRMYIGMPEYQNCLLNLRAGDKYTLDEIGVLHGGVSREAIRQSEERAIRQFRRLFARAIKYGNFRDYLQEDRPEMHVHKHIGKRKRVEY